GAAWRRVAPRGAARTICQQCCSEVAAPDHRTPPRACRHAITQRWHRKTSCHAALRAVMLVSYWRCARAWHTGIS
ncbi:hypothetical protein, partial [Xanthomonas citri]|uniref:hypothetical protein n=1 Tax=Xanthomonas citri TaxID=346 RepID=UPI001F22A49A